VYENAGVNRNAKVSYLDEEGLRMEFQEDGGADDNSSMWSSQTLGRLVSMLSYYCAIILLSVDRYLYQPIPETKIC